MPSQYYNLFGTWQTLDNVPAAWLFDNDGRPWTDGKVVAYEDAGSWYTYTKEWATNDIRDALVDFATGGRQGADPVDLSLLPDELNPILNPYADLGELTEWLNTEAGLIGSENAFRVTEVVEALVFYLTLTREEVPQATIDSWTAQPVTVRYSDAAGLADPTAAEAAAWPLVANWDQGLGEEGLYVLEPGYEAGAPFDALAVLDGANWVVTADDMATVVKDNTSENTNYFGIPGYFEDVIEDLSNINTFFAIELEQAAIPALTEFTMRITIIDTGSQVAPPADDPAGEGDSDNGSSGGCTVSNEGRLDPTLPAILALALGLIGWRRLRTGR